MDINTDFIFQNIFISAYIKNVVEVNLKQWNLKKNSMLVINRS